MIRKYLLLNSHFFYATLTLERISVNMKFKIRGIIAENDAIGPRKFEAL